MDGPSKNRIPGQFIEIEHEKGFHFFHVAAASASNGNIRRRPFIPKVFKVRCKGAIKAIKSQLLPKRPINDTIFGFWLTGHQIAAS